MSILLYYRLGKLFVSKVSKIGNYTLCLQKRNDYEYENRSHRSFDS